MPTADGPNPLLRVVPPVDERSEVYADLDRADRVGVRARRLELLRESQWATEVGVAGALRASLDARFDELEVRR